jgi:prepilin-type N-terminal cleavage/methylation domain-containing protein
MYYLKKIHDLAFIFLYHKIVKKKSTQQGFSMIEIIISVTLVAILLLLAIPQLRLQLLKARDSRRKADLDILKKAFEDYVGDKGEYPPIDILSNCKSADLLPYLQAIPCDPLDKQPYVYKPFPDATDRTGGYRIYTQLEVTTDPVITTVGCSGAEGCGLPEEEVEEAAKYNYGVSQGVSVYYL